MEYFESTSDAHASLSSLNTSKSLIDKEPSSNLLINVDIPSSRTNYDLELRISVDGNQLELSLPQSSILSLKNDVHSLNSVTTNSSKQMHTINQDEIMQTQFPNSTLKETIQGENEKFTCSEQIHKKILEKLFKARELLTPVIDSIILNATKHTKPKNLKYADCPICTLSADQYRKALAASQLIKEVTDDLLQNSVNKMGVTVGEVIHFPEDKLKINKVYLPKNSEALENNEKIYIDKSMMDQLLDLHELLVDTITKLRQIELEQAVLHKTEPRKRDLANQSVMSPDCFKGSNDAPNSATQQHEIATSKEELAKLQEEYEDLNSYVNILKTVVQNTTGSDTETKRPTASEQDFRKSKSANTLSNSLKTKQVTDVSGARRSILECLNELAHVRELLKDMNESDEIDLSNEIQLTTNKQDKECCCRSDVSHLHAKLNGIPVVLKLNQETLATILSSVQSFNTSSVKLYSAKYESETESYPKEIKVDKNDFAAADKTNSLSVLCKCKKCNDSKKLKCKKAKCLVKTANKIKSDHDSACSFKSTPKLTVSDESHGNISQNESVTIDKQLHVIASKCAYPKETVSHASIDPNTREFGITQLLADKLLKSNENLDNSEASPSLEIITEQSANNSESKMLFMNASKATVMSVVDKHFNNRFSEVLKRDAEEDQNVHSSNKPILLNESQQTSLVKKQMKDSSSVPFEKCLQLFKNRCKISSKSISDYAASRKYISFAKYYDDVNKLTINDRNRDKELTAVDEKVIKRSLGDKNSKILEVEKMLGKKQSNNQLKPKISDSGLPYLASINSIPVIHKNRNRTCSSMIVNMNSLNSKLHHEGICYPKRDIEKQLKELGVDCIIAACRPAKCCRKAVLNERSQEALPYSPSLKSIALDSKDIDFICQNNKTLKEDSKKRSLKEIKMDYYAKLEYCTNLISDNFNKHIFPWVIPNYEVRFFNFFKKDVPTEEDGQSKLSNTNGNKQLKKSKNIVSKKNCPLTSLSADSKSPTSALVTNNVVQSTGQCTKKQESWEDVRINYASEHYQDENNFSLVVPSYAVRVLNFFHKRSRKPLDEEMAHSSRGRSKHKKDQSKRQSSIDQDRPSTISKSKYYIDPDEKPDFMQIPDRAQYSDYLQPSSTSYSSHLLDRGVSQISDRKSKRESNRAKGSGASKALSKRPVMYRRDTGADPIKFGDAQNIILPKAVDIPYEASKSSIPDFKCRKKIKAKSYGVNLRSLTLKEECSCVASDCSMPKELPQKDTSESKKSKCSKRSFKMQDPKRSRSIQKSAGKSTVCPCKDKKTCICGLSQNNKQTTFLMLYDTSKNVPPKKFSDDFKQIQADQVVSKENNTQAYSKSLNCDKETIPFHYIEQKEEYIIDIDGIKYYFPKSKENGIKKTCNTTSISDSINRRQRKSQNVKFDPTQTVYDKSTTNKVILDKEYSLLVSRKTIEIKNSNTISFDPVVQYSTEIKNNPLVKKTSKNKVVQYKSDNEVDKICREKTTKQQETDDTPKNKKSTSSAEKHARHKSKTTNFDNIIVNNNKSVNTHSYSPYKSINFTSEQSWFGLLDNGHSTNQDKEHICKCNSKLPPKLNKKMKPRKQCDKPTFVSTLHVRQSSEIVVKGCFKFLNLRTAKTGSKGSQRPSIARSHSAPDSYLHGENNKELDKLLVGRRKKKIIAPTTDLKSIVYFKKNDEIGKKIKPENNFAKGSALGSQITQVVPVPKSSMKKLGEIATVPKYSPTAATSKLLIPLKLECNLSLSESFLNTIEKEDALMSKTCSCPDLSNFTSYSELELHMENYPKCFSTDHKSTDSVTLKLTKHHAQTTPLTIKTQTFQYPEYPKNLSVCEPKKSQLLDVAKSFQMIPQGNNGSSTKTYYNDCYDLETQTIAVLNDLQLFNQAQLHNVSNNNKFKHNRYRLINNFQSNSHLAQSILNSDTNDCCGQINNFQNSRSLQELQNSFLYKEATKNSQHINCFPISESNRTSCQDFSKSSINTPVNFHHGTNNLFRANIEMQEKFNSESNQPVLQDLINCHTNQQSKVEPCFRNMNGQQHFGFVSNQTVPQIYYPSTINQENVNSSCEEGYHLNLLQQSDFFNQNNRDIHNNYSDDEYNNFSQNSFVTQNRQPQNTNQSGFHESEKLNSNHPIINYAHLKFNNNNTPTPLPKISQYPNVSYQIINEVNTPTKSCEIMTEKINDNLYHCNINQQTQTNTNTQNSLGFTSEQMLPNAVFNQHFDSNQHGNTNQESSEATKESTEFLQNFITNLNVLSDLFEENHKTFPIKSSQEGPLAAPSDFLHDLIKADENINHNICTLNVNSQTDFVPFSNQNRSKVCSNHGFTQRNRRDPQLQAYVCEAQDNIHSSAFCIDSQMIEDLNQQQNNKETSVVTHQESFQFSELKKQSSSPKMCEEFKLYDSFPLKQCILCYGDKTVFDTQNVIMQPLLNLCDDKDVATSSTAASHTQSMPSDDSNRYSGTANEEAQFYDVIRPNQLCSVGVPLVSNSLSKLLHLNLQEVSAPSQVDIESVSKSTDTKFDTRSASNPNFLSSVFDSGPTTFKSVCLVSSDENLHASIRSKRCNTATQTYPILLHQQLRSTDDHSFVSNLELQSFGEVEVPKIRRKMLNQVLSTYVLHQEKDETFDYDLHIEGVPCENSELVKAVSRSIMHFQNFEQQSLMDMKQIFMSNPNKFQTESNHYIRQNFIVGAATTNTLLGDNYKTSQLKENESHELLLDDDLRSEHFQKQQSVTRGTQSLCFNTEKLLCIDSNGTTTQWPSDDDEIEIKMASTDLVFKNSDGATSSPKRQVATKAKQSFLSYTAKTTSTPAIFADYASQPLSPEASNMSKCSSNERISLNPRVQSQKAQNPENPATESYKRVAKFSQVQQDPLVERGSCSTSLFEEKEDFNKAKVCWALTKVNVFGDGSREFEILEVSPIPPGHYLVPSTNSVVLLGNQPYAGDNKKQQHAKQRQQ